MMATIDDEKQPLLMKDLENNDVQPDHQQQQQRRQQSPSSGIGIVRYTIFSFIIICALLASLPSRTIVCRFPAPEHHTEYGIHHSPGASSSASSTSKIALEAHIMSKCPDARDCLRQLVVPTMEKVSDKVDFRLSYIGRIETSSDEVECMHGPGECLGNIIELCVQQEYPDPKLSLGFTNCLSAQYSKIPDREFVHHCALEHGIDFDRINKCISEEGKGMDLLRDSVHRSQVNNVTKSCTVRVEEKVWCIRDGGEWSDCPGGSGVADLVGEIEKLYKKRSE